MGEPVTGLNPRILAWARERAGLSIQDVARTLKKDSNVVHAWERGDDAPTYAQLETLAYNIYKRPIAIFFFPEPPDEPGPKQAFRTLPDFEIQRLSADTRYKVRKARALQLSLAELNDGRNPADRKVFRDIILKASEDVTTVVNRLRRYLGVEAGEQVMWRNRSVALKRWRSMIEKVGVYVFKDTLKQDDVSGFSLFDDEFPIIYLNNSTAESRQIFTSFHELAHILVRASGITKRDDLYIDGLSGVARKVEVFCNRLAGEFLVPSSHFHRRLQGRPYNDALVTQLANYFNVSREVILRKFLDRGSVTPEFYRQRVQQWAEQYKQDSEHLSKEGRGGNYYATQATYLGDQYLSLAFGRYYQGRCSLEQLADYLNVKASSVAGLEQYSLR